MISPVSLIAQTYRLRPAQVEAVLQLLAEGATIPFIARYRKDRTGALDEVQIQQIREEAARLKELEERRAFIEKTISEQGKLTEGLQEQIRRAGTLAELEDLYLPYKPKRKTRAQTAREQGLEPLAQALLAQTDADPEQLATAYITEQVADAAAALQGARDIIAEQLNEDAALRARLRKLFETEARLVARVVEDKKDEAQKYRDYFEYAEPVASIPSHRALAVLRGFMEGCLRIAIEPEEAPALELIEKAVIRGMSPAAAQLQRACRDAYRRLLQPGLETELRTALKARADEEAIQVFAENLRQLLLSAPLGSKRILAIDPGYRTGCKLVCLDEQGNLLHTDLLFPHENNRRPAEAEKVRQLLQRFAIQAFAIGDGTAGRETEQFIKELSTGLPVFMVNEDGASVYSASATAREEFPDQDVTVRGAVSIGRRLMDPLAELVKIDPRSIGVGQYQHDVNPVRLKEKLDTTVVSCVNSVGVNLNTASKHLLSYVSGIGSTLAANIVQYRNQIGRFRNRRQLLEVPRLGEKAFEQCAGFLRIREGDELLDNSAVHPEAYPVVQQMVSDLGVPLETVIGNETLLKQIEPARYAGASIGELTIRDILSELKKPGLDPRAEARAVEFAAIYSIDDVQPGMVVPGVVTNLTRFGAFVDIGVKQDGLVHVSEIAHRYIADPAEVLKLSQQVTVKVVEVDTVRKRIALSIKQAQEPPVRTGKSVPRRHQPQPGNRPAGSMQDALTALKQKFGK